MRERPIRGAMHESLRVWILCNAMNWNVLPVRGGLYDQDPELLDDFVRIFSRKAQKEEEEQRKREAEMRSRRSR